MKLQPSNFLMETQRTAGHSSAPTNDIRTAHGSAATIYRTMQTNAATSNQRHVTAAPRNKEQVRNVLKTDRNRARPSRDALYNLIELAYNSEFIHDIHVIPDLWAIMYSQEIIDIFRATLTPGSPVQVLSYDTTFNLGDFYLSVLLFRETEFDQLLTIPLAFLLHEQKLTSTHEQEHRAQTTATGRRGRSAS